MILWFYLKGISTGDFSEALRALVGSPAGLSPATVCRLKVGWQQEWETWQQRDLTGKRYVYFWVDGLHLNVRMDEAPWLWVVIAATPDGHKELVTAEDGVHKSEQSWKDLLLNLQRRGLKVGPALAIGDGALGFWKAVSQVYGVTQWQRCWCHKTQNILNKLPKSIQPKAKQALQPIWRAESKATAERTFDVFLETYEPKYSKATACLQKDREELLAFYAFPAHHWQSLRTTNPIESPFGTIRHRPVRTKGCLTRDGLLHMMFKLGQCAEKTWRQLRGFRQLEKVIGGVQFRDGLEETTTDSVAAESIA